MGNLVSVSKITILTMEFSLKENTTHFSCSNKTIILFIRSLYINTYTDQIQLQLICVSRTESIFAHSSVLGNGSAFVSNTFCIACRLTLVPFSNIGYSDNRFKCVTCVCVWYLTLMAGVLAAMSYFCDDLLRLLFGTTQRKGSQ